METTRKGTMRGTGERGTDSERVGPAENLPPVRIGNPVIAAFVADVHLSLKPPIARSCEKDWLMAQARPIRQVNSIGLKHGVPVFCGGDLFDKHNPPPELLSWCLKE